jgi:NAD(P)-dependent dehydrogenase (short-subunit alcohol dehydrogenase family)
MNSANNDSNNSDSNSNSKRVWFVTGSARGMGIDIARAALDAGHSVVATARDSDRVTAALGEHADLLPVALDITDDAAVESAVKSAIDRFGRIDVLVNNAGNFYAGFSRPSARRNFGPRWRPTSSGRSTSPAP